MQVISVGSTAQDLCNKLAAVAKPDFFDSVEMADGSTTTVECKKNGATIFKITLTGIVYCEFPNGSTNTFYRYQTYMDFINTIVVASNAIYLRNFYGRGAFIIIAKDTNGELLFIDYESSDNIYPINSDQAAFPIKIYKENGSVITRSYYLNNDDVTKKSYFVPLFVNDDIFVDGMHISIVRPYPNEPGYMPFTIGGIGYVGFGGTTFIVEST